jgi:hypothetical protein
VQEIIKNVPTIENDNNEQEVPEYLRICAGLSLNMTMAEDEVRDRAFHMLTGSVVFGMLVAELTDSFLIAASCILISENGKVDGKPFARAKILRMMKTSVAFISAPEPEHKNYYYKWLKKQYTSLPSFFSQGRRDIIDNFVYNYENRSKPIEQNEDQIEEAPELAEESTKGSADSFWSPYSSTEFH